MKLRYLNRDIPIKRVPHDSPMLSDCEGLIQDGKIYIDKRLSGKPFWHVLIHEFLHHLFPFKAEETVHMEAVILTEALLESDLLKEIE